MGKKGVLVRDGLSDLFTRLRNGQMARRASIRAPYSRLSLSVLSVMTERGYLRGVRVVGPECVRAAQHDQLEIFLKYDPHGKGAINEIRRVSKPSRRIYKRIEKLPVSNAGLGTYLLSTSRGVMHCADARRYRVGGEVLGEIL